MARHPGEAPIDRDEAEDRDTYLGIRKRKRGGRIKHSKATGSPARRRPDRRAAGGGTGCKEFEKEAPKGEAPASGEVEQNFKRQYGGRVPTYPGNLVRSDESGRKVGEDIARRTESVNRPYTEEKFLKGRDEAIPQNYPAKKKAGGHITTAQRKALPSSDFALPGKGKGAGGKGPGSYPIDTPNRARNALARGAQHASPGELATIKRKVHAKYPGIGES